MDLLMNSPLCRRWQVPDYHRIITWDAVGEEEGTGIVHIAPGCGAEDFELGVEFDLPALAPLNRGWHLPARF